MRSIKPTRRRQTKVGSQTWQSVFAQGSQQILQNEVFMLLVRRETPRTDTVQSGSDQFGLLVLLL